MIPFVISGYVAIKSTGMMCGMEMASRARA